MSHPPPLSVDMSVSLADLYLVYQSFLDPNFNVYSKVLSSL